MSNIFGKVALLYRLAVVGKIGSCIVIRIGRKRGVLHPIGLRVATNFHVVIRSIMPIDEVRHFIV